MGRYPRTEFVHQSQGIDALTGVTNWSKLCLAKGRLIANGCNGVSEYCSVPLGAAGFTSEGAAGSAAFGADVSCRAVKAMRQTTGVASTSVTSMNKGGW